MLNEVKHLACECDVRAGVCGDAAIVAQILRSAQDDASQVGRF